MLQYNSAPKYYCGTRSFVRCFVGLIKCNGDKSSLENMEKVVKTEKEKDEKIEEKI
jgi:hypothetical protein